MSRNGRKVAYWIALCGMLVMAAVLVPLWGVADTGAVGFTATLYADVVRFEADGVASLRVTIYDLAENELWSSGRVSSDFVDWDRTNERGERLANGYYLYLAQGWDSSDRLVLNKAGKVVLLPGDQVELRSAPVVGAIGDVSGDGGSGSFVTTMGLGDTGIFGAVGIGIDPPPHPLSVREVNTDVSGNVNAASMYLDGNPSATSDANYYAQNLKARTEDGGSQDYTGTLAGIMLQSTHRGSGTVDDLYGANFVATLSGTGTINTAAAARYAVKDQGGTIGQGYGILIDQVDGTSAFGVYVDVPASNYFQGSVGIGTTSPGQKLDVAGTGRFTGALTVGSYTLPAADGANGQVLATNGNGSVSWQTVAGGGSGYWTATGDDIANSNAGSITLFSGGVPFLHESGTDNTFLGRKAGNADMTGQENTAVGRAALSLNSSGDYNTCVGDGALYCNTTGFNNTAFGWGALNHNTIGAHNAATGAQALLSNTSGNSNAALGEGAMSSNTTGSENAAVGHSALATNASGLQNTAVGCFALSDATASRNSAVGYDALGLITNGERNIALGYLAGYGLVDGSDNIYLGNQGQSQESGTIRIGDGSHTSTYIAGIRGASVTGGEYVVIDNEGRLGSAPSAGSAWAMINDDLFNINAGEISLYSSNDRFLHSFGTHNVFLGKNAGNFTLTAGGHTAVGYNALSSNTSGEINTALGCFSLTDNTGGHRNTAVGRDSLRHNTDGYRNTAVGHAALQANDDGNLNVAIGDQALFSNVHGSNNIALGADAGYNLEDGTHNIYIGHDGAVNESNTIRIGDGDQADTYIAGIYGATSSGGVPVYVGAGGRLGTVTSSARFKTDIADLASSSEVLYSLRPVTFKYKPEIDPAGIAQYGLIAEEVAEVAPDLVINDENGDPYTVRYEQLVPLLLNEVQKLRASNDDLLARLDALEEEVAALR